MEKNKVLAFGDLLKEFRKQRKITQQELAIRLGVHRNTIGTWEHGDFLPESKTIVLELASQLRLDVHDTRCLLEASLTALSPYWHVPHQRNPFFTGRKDVLQQLHDILSHEHRAVSGQSYVLSGLGGIGKTQTAIEYAYRYANEYAAVFWVSAETTESIISSMVSIAAVLDLPEEQDQEKVITAVTRWLSNHSDWLLILDNVEDPARVKGVLPSVRSGCLLFTTRRQALGLGAQPLDLEQMTLEEGTHLLLCRARLLNPLASLDTVSATDLTLARRIVKQMDGLPLALDQAGAYIEATRCSLADYLRLFQSSQVRLLDERDTFADHPLSVTRTFALAFERLEQSNAAAAALLTTCAFLAPEAIPETFFTEGAAYLGPMFEALAADPFAFHDAIKALLTYSLIQRNASTRTMTIHRLVQVVLQGHLSETVRHTGMAGVVRAMAYLFPTEETQADYWQLCERLLPHALVCIKLCEQYSEDAVVSITLMCHVATYLFQRAQYVEAASLFERAVHMGEQTLGPQDLMVAEALHGLADLYREQGRCVEANPLFQRVLDIRERILGAEHPLVAEALNNLGLLYWQEGKYEQAEPLYQRALTIREQSLGPEHPQVAEVLNNLGMLYDHQCKYEQAEPLYQRALTIREQALGSEHPQLAYSLNNLGMLYWQQGKYEQVEPLYQRALAIREQALGPEHPQLAYPLNNLGALYREQGKYEQAEPLYQRALHIWEQTSGFDHPDAAYPLNGLANLYREQGKYKQAKPLFQRALTLRQSNLGAYHPVVAVTLHDLARLYQAQQQYTEALPLYQQALTIREQALGPNHPKTVDSRSAVLHLLQEMGRREESESYQKPDVMPNH